MRHISSVKHIPLDISLLVSSTSSFPSEDSLSSSLTALVPALVVFVALRLTMIRLLAHVTQSLCYEFQCSQWVKEMLIPVRNPKMALKAQSHKFLELLLHVSKILNCSQETNLEKFFKNSYLSFRCFVKMHTSIQAMEAKV